MTSPAELPAAVLTIGEVMNDLADDFPEVSVSKIRFLEAEGLITPSRTSGGVRRFGAADVDRLRYILTLQRDYYLPLRVIRDRLSSADGGETDEEEAISGEDPPVTRRELLAASGMSSALLREAEAAGFIATVPQGSLYPAAAVEVCSILAGLLEVGVEIRHLRGVIGAVEREAEIVRALTAPVALRRDRGAAGQARAQAGTVTATLARLHEVLLHARVAADLAELVGE